MSMLGNRRPPNAYHEPFALRGPAQDRQLFLMACVSHSVLVLLRRNLGSRLLQPWLFCLLFLGMFGLGYVSTEEASASADAHAGGWALMVFATLMGLMFGRHRREARAVELDPVVLRDSESRGNSILSPLFGRLRIPEWVVQRWIEPFLVFGVGLWLVTEMHWGLLGWWLACSGPCLAGIESTLLREERAMLIDGHDAYVRALRYQRSLPVLSTTGEGGNAAENPPDTAVAQLSPDLIRLMAAKRAPGAKKQRRRWFRRK